MKGALLYSARLSTKSPVSRMSSASALIVAIFFDPYFSSTSVLNSLSEFCVQLCFQCSTNQWPELIWFTYTARVSRHHHHHHQSLNREGRWGTTDDFATTFLHFSLFSTALWDLPNSRPVHSLMSSSHLFLCLPCLLPPFTVPCKMDLARPDERDTLPYHCSLRLFTMVRRSSCGPIACWILARTSSLVTWSLYEMRSILR